MAPAGPQAPDFHRQHIQVAIARAAELRAIHAALLQGGGNGSAGTLRSPSLWRASHPFTAGNYPVFTPSYEKEPLPAYQILHSESQNSWANSGRIGLQRDEENGKGYLSDDEDEIKLSSMSRKDQTPSATDGQKFHPSSCTNHVFLQKPSSVTDNITLARRSSSEACEVVTACNECKPATITKVTESEHENYGSTSSAVHASATHQSSLQLHQNSRAAALSWLFPIRKRKPKSDISPQALEPEDKSGQTKDCRICSGETLKRELIDANENRDSVSVDVGGMRSSFTEMKQKLMHLEAYCKELKEALQETKQDKDEQFVKKHILTKRTKSIGSSRACSMPVGHEVMLEGFLQVGSEARVSVKQFCKTLISQTEENNIDLIGKLNVLIPSSNLMPSCRCTKELQYHLESFVNQTLHEDFENCVFQTNGAQKILDPQQYCLENFSTFAALRTQSWKAVLTKGSQDHNEELSKFCDRKVCTVISLLGWSGPWPEQLHQSFFVAAKCIWILHLLAFSFNPPLAILRVEKNKKFDPLYMEDVLLDRQRVHAPAHVKIMVVPGFYEQDRVVIKSKVLCSNASIV